MNLRHLLHLCLTFTTCLLPSRQYFAQAEPFETDQLRSACELLLPTSPSWLFYTGLIGAEIGRSVSTAGDVNGDGYSDVIVGGPKYEDSTYREGVAFVFHGSPAGLALTPAWKAGGAQKGAKFGSLVASAGDVDGDGYDEVLVGAYRYNNGLPEEGAVFLYQGSPTGLSAGPDWTFYGGQKYAQLGGSAAGAGDVNGDGYADIVIGARWYSLEHDKEGAVFVFFGSPDGLKPAPDQIFSGGQINAQFGVSVASAGDLNGDGFADVVIGAPLYDGQSADLGALFVLFGSEEGLRLDPGMPVLGLQAGAQFGEAVSGAGDVNGDGFDDLIVGAPLYTGAHEREGAAYLYYGTSLGVSKTPGWSAEGGQAFAQFGRSVASAGNTNGDLYAEVLIGSYMYTHDQPAEGRVLLFLGSQNGLLDSPTWIADGNKAETSFGYSVASAGDVDQDGLDDLIVGAPTYRSSKLITGRAFAYYSSGSVLPPEPPDESTLLFLPIVSSFSSEQE